LNIIFANTFKRKQGSSKRMLFCSSLFFLLTYSCTFNKLFYQSIVMNKLFCLSVLCISLAACESNSAGYKATASTPAATPAINLPAAPLNATADTGKKGITTTTTAEVPAVTTSATQTNTTNKTNAALNPAHGQPGHRCDIPEGAPLNSAPATNATVPVNNNKNVTVAPVVSQPQPPAKGNVRLNPAHGAPGHDCAIAVGQPLKS
jgi:hypothetical protein